ncbi:MAG: DUF881 domain-containing protein [Clostridia bacterium]|nr:DUF881 domain-containing protein [Clostridia bacterium]
MKNQKMVSIVLGMLCFALTLGICIQIKTVTGSNSIVGENKGGNDELRAEVLRYKEKYDQEYKELEKAEKELEKERQHSTQNNSDLEQKEDAIKKGNKMIGMTEVTGPGVIVTLSDGKKDPSTVLDASNLIVHDADVLSVINELKNAGAEAISINDQRIVPTTSISCGGNIIDINGEKVGAPFEIKAIGLPEQLSALTRQGGYLELLKEASVGVELKKSNHITIPKYTGVINYKYAQNSK